MDADRFDILARSLTDARSRRRALATLLAGTLGLRRRTDAAAKKKKGKKAKGKNKKKGGESAAPVAPVAPASPPGPTCSDTIQNGSETDVDCGGPTCQRCAIGQTCASRDDCASALCLDTTCGQCAVNEDCGLDTNGDPCFCRTNAANERVCTRQLGRFDLNFTCADCLPGEQCVLPGVGAECNLPCGAP
jgi:hypothetical protein